MYAGISCGFRPGSHDVCAESQTSLVAVVVRVRSRDARGGGESVRYQCDVHFLLVPDVCSLSAPPPVIVTLELQRMLQVLVTAVLHEHSLRRCPTAS